jgi:hypothetical protein
VYSPAASNRYTSPADRATILDLVRIRIGREKRISGRIDDAGMK